MLPIRCRSWTLKTLHPFLHSPVPAESKHRSETVQNCQTSSTFETEAHAYTFCRFGGSGDVSISALELLLIGTTGAADQVSPRRVPAFEPRKVILHRDLQARALIHGFTGQGLLLACDASGQYWVPVDVVAYREICSDGVG